MRLGQHLCFYECVRCNGFIQSKQVCILFIAKNKSISDALINFCRTRSQWKILLWHFSYNSVLLQYRNVLSIALSHCALWHCTIFKLCIFAFSVPRIFLLWCYLPVASQSCSVACPSIQQHNAFTFVSLLSCHHPFRHITLSLDPLHAKSIQSSLHPPRLSAGITFLHNHQCLDLMEDLSCCKKSPHSF